MNIDTSTLNHVKTRYLHYKGVLGKVEVYEQKPEFQNDDNIFCGVLEVTLSVNNESKDYESIVYGSSIKEVIDNTHNLIKELLLLFAEEVYGDE